MRDLALATEQGAPRMNDVAASQALLKAQLLFDQLAKAPLTDQRKRELVMNAGAALMGVWKELPEEPVLTARACRQTKQLIA